MKFKGMVCATVAMVALSGCSSTCTEDEMQAKLLEITEKVQDIAATGDMGRLMELSKKANDIGMRMKGSEDDLQAACEAADELLSEL